MLKNSTVHQLAYLTPDRAVAWKCLSLQALESLSRKEFAPVAYTSRSPHFFPEFASRGRLHCDGATPDALLWVITCPMFKMRHDRDKTFPPTLAARIVVEKVVTGDVVRSWGDEGNRALTVPPGEDKAFQNWRRAVSVRGARRRATFRITRDFAILTWNKEKKRNPRFTQLDAWKSVRTAIADTEHSKFLAHTDATTCLSQALGLPGIEKQSLEERKRTIAWQLMSPRRLSANNQYWVSCLEQLAEAGSQNTIFMNYRWNQQAEYVADIGLGLLEQGCGIWLDRLQIPDLKSHPVWRLRGRQRRKDPPQIELEQLLHNAVQRSSLFLSLAAHDYEHPPADDPDGENWAQKERSHAIKLHHRHGTPTIGIVDLGGAPECLGIMQGPQWCYWDDPPGLPHKIARVARRY